MKDPTNRQALETSVELRPPVLEKIFDKEFLGRKWKHVIEPRAVYRMVTGVNDFANVLHFDERDLLSNTHEVEYGFVTRLYAKRSSLQRPASRDFARKRSGLRRVHDRPGGRQRRAGADGALAARRATSIISRALPARK